MNILLPKPVPIIFIPSIFRVPLLPRQPPPDPLDDKKKKSVGACTVAGLAEISGEPLNHQLIFHAYNTAIIYISSSVGWY